jgi:hypothetical protein
VPNAAKAPKSRSNPAVTDPYIAAIAIAKSDRVDKFFRDRNTGAGDISRPRFLPFIPVWTATGNSISSISFSKKLDFLHQFPEFVRI